MAAELGWNEERMADEQASVREFYEIGNPSVRREDADLGQS
jgi:hypothetical protein